jgi:inhibitor of cysteine peptidase
MKIGTMWVNAIVLVSVLLAACASSSPEIRLTEKDKKIGLKTGQVFTIALEGNPTTGYTWEPLGMDEKLLARLGDAVFQPESNAVGAGGVISLRFKAVSPGSATLTLVYQRPWEKGQPPLKTIEFAVTIK